MELLRIWSAVLRRKWWIVQSIVLFTAVGVASALLLPKSYQATARLMVSSSDATSALLSDLGLQELAVGLSGSSDEIQDHIALLTTRPLLTELVWRLQLRDSDGELFEADKVLIPGTFAMLTADPVLEVKQNQSTSQILVTATADDAEKARLMADTAATLYIEATRERSRKETEEVRSFIDTRLLIVRDEFDKALSDIAAAQQQEQVIDLDSEVKSAVARLSELMLMEEEVLTRSQEIDAQIMQLRGVHDIEDVDFIGPGTVSENPDIKSIRDTLVQLQLQRATTLLEKTPKHPDVQRLEAQIREAESELADALEEQHELDPQLIRLEVERAGLGNKKLALDDAINRTTERFSQYPEKMKKIAQLQLAASAAEEVYKSLLGQSYQIAVAEAMAATPIQLVEPAKRPDKQVSPKLLVNIIVGFAVGLLVGAGIVALLEYVDDSVRTPEDLKEVWAARQLGRLPKGRAGLGITIADRPAGDPALESVRALRSSVTVATIDAPPRKILVTSALPGEGKSTTLVNLAVSFAQEGKRVLIVDADMRVPTQHTFWTGTTNAAGLTDLLMGQKALGDVVQATPVEGLSLLSSGPVPQDPGGLAGSRRIAALLEELAGAYDLVLVDTPPVMVVTDATEIGRAVDQVIIVVEAHKTSRRVIADARERTEGSSLPVLGLVLNKLDLGVAGYGAYQKAYKAYGAKKA